MLGTYALSSGLLRRVLRAGAEGADASSAGVRRRVRARSTSSSRRRRRPSRSRSARRPTTRSRCTSCDVLTIPSNMAGLPGLSIPCGLSEGCRWASSCSGRSSPRTCSSAPGTRSSRRSASTVVPERLGPHELGAGHRLEIHVQLKTRRRCSAARGRLRRRRRTRRPARSASRIPGTLPVPNARRSSGRSGSASRSAAKSPITPSSTARTTSIRTPQGLSDLPVRRASVHRRFFTRPGADGDTEIGIVRAHLEEDAAKNVHMAGRTGRIHGADRTLVDFNRSGTPLVEIVTEPDLRSAEQTKRFLQLLRQTVRELDISDAEMQEGSMRFDINVSVRPEGSDELRHAHRAQEPQLVQLRRARDRARDRAANRDLRGGRAGRAGDAPLRARAGARGAAAFEGGGAGLSLLPRARPRPARPAGGNGRACGKGARRAAERAHSPPRGGARLRARRGSRDERPGRALRADARRPASRWRTW